MERNKSVEYIQVTDFNTLSREMINDLTIRNDTLPNGNRFCRYFVFARGKDNSGLEVYAAIIEEKNADTPLYYAVPLVDNVSGAYGISPYHTKEATEESLAKTLQMIWDDLSHGGSDSPDLIQTANERRSLTVNRKAEFEYLKAYISGCCLDSETSVALLYSLWVAYCLHQNLTVDTPDYKASLAELWGALAESDDGEPSHWEAFSDFELDMGRDLR